MGDRKQGVWSRVRGSIGWGGAVLALGVVAVMVWAATAVDSASHDPQHGVASFDRIDWGAEVVGAVFNSTIAKTLVPPANACGLGASSCFRCHNGKRAPAPNQDPVAAPWHVQHAKVNHSCAGCHQGNPRLMREAMAHKDLIADPRTAPGETCASCHRGASEVDEHLARYLQIGS